MMGPDGNLVYSVENTDFQLVKDVKGASFRVPMKSQLTSPKEKLDLVVEWKDREFNKALPDPKFQMVPPACLPPC